MRIDLLKKQHRDIKELVKQLLDIPEDELVEKAFDISKIIGRLSGILTIHLKSEDDYLYPILEKSENKTIQNTAKKFSAKMGDLSHRFNAFKSMYMIGKNIKVNPKQFKKDLDTLAKALLKRIEREEKELYILIKNV